ncbi:hypothetical protein [Flavobacterium pectinovorum]|uniref:Uncharacterized protein n=1 Tax=Flavobacterium pectinovorum TaxID=29533 RepID=A0AB36NW34_9FLAO|nr:hypothetical protein [Flavobacterium pectinovorum]OXB00840.1 hypothetical protein B0A72_18890 [Flavobacterium pectinovorum]SHN19531.1 hypothetical protein SAMN05444387_4601 [Flavobacterium pectinovorum]
MADIIPSIIEQKYYAGQLLQVEDFNRERDFHIQYRNFGNQQLLSSGVLSGLIVDKRGSTINVSSGAAIDINGAYILLTAEKSYAVTSADGDYQFVISHQTIPVPGTKNQLKSDPALSLIAAGKPINDAILLANVTITNKVVSKLEDAALAVQILSSRIPEQSIQNLDASVITKGIFDRNHIPDLQNLNGKLTPSQLPVLPNNDNAIVQNAFTTGVITGLTASNTDKIAQLTSGIAVDASGNQIVLDNTATYNNSTITAQKGIFSLDMSDPVFQDKTWLLLISPNTADSGSPILEFAENKTKDKVILATVRVTAGLVVVSSNDRESVELKTDRLPELTPDILPDIKDLKGRVAIIQLPGLGEMTGKLNPGQVPQIQELQGQLTVGQLPPDIIGTKEYLTFFVNQAVVGEGAKIQFSWITDKGVDSLSLSYFSEVGINNLSTGDNAIKLTDASFSYTILATTTFTLTALIKGVIVGQKQLTITVFTLLELARLQFANNKSANDCISLILNQFPTATANDSAIALAKAGYKSTETAGALKIGFPKLTPAQVAAALSAAFGKTTPADLAKSDKEKGLTAIEAGGNLVSQFPGISAMDFGVSLGQAGYSTEQLGPALKQYFPKLSPAEVANIFHQSYK